MSIRADTKLEFSMYFKEQPEIGIIREFADRAASCLIQELNDAGIRYSAIKISSHVGYDFMTYYEDEPYET